MPGSSAPPAPPFEVGLPARHRAGAALRAFLADGLSRIGRLAAGPVSWTRCGRLAAYDAAIAAATPG